MVKYKFTHSEPQEKFIFKLETKADVMLPEGKWLIDPKDATAIFTTLLTEARKKWLEEGIAILESDIWKFHTCFGLEKKYSLKQECIDEINEMCMKSHNEDLQALISRLEAELKALDK